MKNSFSNAKILIPLFMLLLSTSCKSPFNRTKDASGGGATGTVVRIRQLRDLQR